MVGTSGVKEYFLKDFSMELTKSYRVPNSTIEADNAWSTLQCTIPKPTNSHKWLFEKTSFLSGTMLHDPKGKNVRHGFGMSLTPVWRDFLLQAQVYDSERSADDLSTFLNQEQWDFIWLYTARLVLPITETVSRNFAETFGKSVANCEAYKLTAAAINTFLLVQMFSDGLVKNYTEYWRKSPVLMAVLLQPTYDGPGVRVPRSLRYATAIAPERFLVRYLPRPRTADEIRTCLKHDLERERSTIQAVWASSAC